MRLTQDKQWQFESYTYDCAIREQPAQQSATIEGSEVAEAETETLFFYFVPINSIVITDTVHGRGKVDVGHEMIAICD